MASRCYLGNTSNEGTKRPITDRLSSAGQAQAGSSRRKKTLKTFPDTLDSALNARTVGYVELFDTAPRDQGLEKKMKLKWTRATVGDGYVSGDWSIGKIHQQGRGGAWFRLTNLATRKFTSYRTIAEAKAAAEAQS